VNLLDLFVKISVDDSGVDSGFSEAGKKANALASKLKGGLATAAKAGAAALTAAATGISILTKKSIEGYAEYEQLVGGVETLFKNSADQVIEYANRAYETAGLSANEYMDTVTSFSASLLQGLGGDTEKAAEVANQAVIDMADNANKMGTSMEMIQNAYQGFAKQNYTMLDNLKLGYGGTATEMARLINDSGVLGDTVEVTADTVNSVSFDKMIEAIHVIQDQMGITGTTAEEAASTIEGSVNMMKSAWSNLVTGIADDNADLDQLIENFTYSVSKATENIIPRVEKILTGFGDLIVKLAPVITAQLPSFVSTVLPPLVAAATELINGLIAALPSIVQSLIDVVPTIIQSFVDIAPTFLEALLQITAQVIQGVAEKLPEIMAAFASAIPALVEILTSPDNLVALVEASTMFIVALVEGLVDNLPTLLDEAPKIIKNLASAFIQSIGYIGEAAIEIGIALVKGIWEGIKRMGDWLTGMVKGFFDGIVDGVKGVLGIHSPSRVFAGIGENMALGLGEGWDNEYGNIKRSIASGMDFGTASVDFGASGVAAIGNSIASGVGALAASGVGSIVINLTTELDGAVLARKMVPYNAAEALRSGA
jgi:phage-related protein